MKQHFTSPGATRRDAISLLGLGAGAVALSPVVAQSAHAATGAAPDTLEAAFRAAFAGAVDKPAQAAVTRLAFLDDAALIVDHDAPFPMSKSGYADHLTFQMAALERSETRFYDVKVALHGNSGIVSAYFMERSKPRDAGFRLRAGYCTTVCNRSGEGWRALGLHLSPLIGQITDQSPG